MLIGLLSDTHIPEAGRSLPQSVRDSFQGVDRIFHLGDIYVSAVLDELEEIAPLTVVRGDDDILRDPRVQDKVIMEIEGLKIGLIHRFHGLYFLWGMEQGMDNQFGSHMDVVVFGDTHSALVKPYSKNGLETLLVNPGSPMLPNYFHRLGSVGLLEITDGKAEARIVELK